MTLIIGIQCSDGVVVGSDGAATLGALGNQTVQQPVKKLAIISGSVILGVSGPVGLGQRFHGELQALWDGKKLSSKKPYEAMSIIRPEFWKHAELEFRAAQVTAPMLGQPALNGALSHSVVAMPLSKDAHLFQFDQNCSPELATTDLPFIAVGSGQKGADPFLAFLRRIFWTNGQPSVADGVFATIWCLDQAIRTNPGGVGDPIQVMTLEKITGNWAARELSALDFEEHRQNIAEAEQALANYKKEQTTGGKSAPPPPPEPERV
ncbi:MAG TPA: hypothetical protein VMU80_25505 [Bryobacteraceae bacterium]|nr:hypothetical protein [Bryobacteraceae bacterium]